MATRYHTRSVGTGVLFYLLDRTLVLGEILLANNYSRTDRGKASLFVVLIILSVYSFPFLTTTAALKSDKVPFCFAPDLSLYLNLSIAGTSGINPYFGSAVHTDGVGYSTFDLAFRPLGLLIRLVKYDLWKATLIWNLFWWIASCLGALWFFRLAFPEEQRMALWLGMPLLFFFNFGVVKSLIWAWLHFPSLAGFRGLYLPDIRVVFPQTPLALLLIYLSLQVRVLRFSHWYDWAAMSCVQVLGLGTFPYSTMIMAVTTTVALLADIGEVIKATRLRAVLGYSFVCAFLDVAYLRLRLSSGTQQPSPALISFHPSHVVGLLGGALLLLISLTAATSIFPNPLTLATKRTIVGLGVANSLLLLGDVVFSPALLISHHAGYFVHTTISLQIVYLVSMAFSRLKHSVRWLKPVGVAAIALITLNGIVLALADYRYSLPENRNMNDLASALRSAGLTSEDLVLAPAETVDDSCAWVPLFSSGRVLFCRSAQYELSTEEKRGTYRLRQAFYLYFTGKDSGEIGRILSDPSNLTAQDRLAFAGEINPADKDRLEMARTAIGTDLVPLLLQVEQRNRQVSGFFTPHKRVLVIDHAENAKFKRPRLLEYLSIDQEIKFGDLVFLWCKAL